MRRSALTGTQPAQIAPNPYYVERWTLAYCDLIALIDTDKEYDMPVTAG